MGEAEINNGLVISIRGAPDPNLLSVRFSFASFPRGFSFLRRSALASHYEMKNKCVLWIQPPFPCPKLSVQVLMYKNFDRNGGFVLRLGSFCGL